MPRRPRSWIDDSCYHITHRCNNKMFLFKYDKYKKFYKRQLFKMKNHYKIDILDYIITSNHVHLLVKIKNGAEISEGLRFLHGRMGQWYNLQNKCSGAFWSDRFHSTRIQSGRHLGACLFYIDLNMVRAGVVEHPSEWAYGSYNEFIEKTQRCCIINKAELLNSLHISNFEDFKKWYLLTLNDKLKDAALSRQDFWSKAIAVGNKNWLNEEAENMGVKRFKVFNANEDQCFIGKG
jgi:REP-associated tyrosine transposase